MNCIFHAHTMHGTIVAPCSAETFRQYHNRTNYGNEIYGVLYKLFFKDIHAGSELWDFSCTQWITYHSASLNCCHMGWKKSLHSYWVRSMASPASKHIGKILPAAMTREIHYLQVEYTDDRSCLFVLFFFFLYSIWPYNNKSKSQLVIILVIMLVY